LVWIPSPPSPGFSVNFITPASPCSIYAEFVFDSLAEVNREYHISEVYVGLGYYCRTKINGLDDLRMSLAERRTCQLRLGENHWRVMSRVATSHSFALESMPLNVPQNPVFCFCSIPRGTVCAMPCRNFKLATTNPVLGDTECFDLRRRKPFDWRAV